MKSCSVEFTQLATAQIQRIFAYIAEDNPTAALKMVDKIEAETSLLEHTPYMGIELPQSEYPFLSPGYRRLVVKPFLIYYRIDGDFVYITHIIHERRNQAKAFEDECLE